MYSLLGFSAILTEVIKAQEVLESQFNVGADVWSVTSYVQLYRDGHAADRWNMLHPGEPAKVPYVTQCLKDAQGVFVAAPATGMFAGAPATGMFAGSPAAGIFTAPPPSRPR